MAALTKKEIINLFHALNKELSKEDSTGELYIVGGAVMCLVYESRISTADIDAVFKPKEIVREAAKRVAEMGNYDENWLNDAVKGFFGGKQEFSDYLELSNLKVYCASPEYLLAMKCLAMRIGKEFHDETDVRYLLRYLNIESYDVALKIIAKFYPEDKFPQKTLYALEEILG